MKKLLTPLSVILSAVIAAGAAAPAAVYAAKDEFEKKEITAYLYRMDKTKTIECVFSSDLPGVPYITAEDYFGCVVDGEFSGSKNDDGTYTVSSAGGKLIVDTENDTMFTGAGQNIFNGMQPFTEGSIQDAPYLKKVEKDGETSGGGDSTIDFGAYDIDLIEKDSKAYFPLTTISDLFYNSYNMGLYFDGSIYFVHVMEDLNGKAYFDKTSAYHNLERDPKVAEYTYNELCFVMDNMYGYPSRASDIGDTMRTNGFDMTLDIYGDESERAKKLICSDDVTEFIPGLFYLSDLFDDGGHTAFHIVSSYINMDADSPLLAALNSRYTDQTDPDLEVMQKVYSKNIYDSVYLSKLVDYRSGEYKSYEFIKSWDIDDATNIWFFHSDDTAVFAFDQFRNEVVEPFKWSLDYAKENGIKNFVIDVSCNKGGLSSVLMYMLGIMTNNKYHTNLSPVLNLYGGQAGSIESSEASYVDYNLDGEFNDLDKEVEYDFNFAVLTSEQSFSCGNLFPSMAHDEGIAIIGERSGGGSCGLAVFYTPELMPYTISGRSKNVSKNGEDIDIGVPLDFELVHDTSEDEDTLKISSKYSDFYDIDHIGELIEAYYSGDKSALQSLTEESAKDPSQQSEESGRTSSENLNGSSGSALPWIIGASAAALVIVIVCVIIVAKKKKHSAALPEEDVIDDTDDLHTDINDADNNTADNFNIDNNTAENRDTEK